VNVRHPDGMTTSDGVVTDENGVDGLVLNLVATIFSSAVHQSHFYVEPLVADCVNHLVLSDVFDSLVATLHPIER